MFRQRAATFGAWRGGACPDLSSRPAVCLLHLCAADFSGSTSSINITGFRVLLSLFLKPQHLLDIFAQVWGLSALEVDGSVVPFRVFGKLILSVLLQKENCLFIFVNPYLSIFLPFDF